MEKEAAIGVACEVCAKVPARREDILCGDCSRAFVILLELLHDHPELGEQDLDRLRQVFDWRMKKTQPLRPHPKVEAALLS